jgi:hypothetical protein
MEFLQKLEIESTCDPAILLLGRYPKELKTGSQGGITTSLCTATLFAIAKMCKQVNIHQHMNT